MTRAAELIYNTFLRISRTKQGKPFRYRKDFSEFESDPNYVYVKRLENFFQRFPHISIDDFFLAPYTVYPEQTYYGLDFYLSPKAVKVYTIYNKARNNANPDSEPQIDFIMKSFGFIYNFCVEQKINFEDYVTHKTGLFPSFLLHLKEHKISIYVLYAWLQFEDEIGAVDPKELTFTLRHLFDTKIVFETEQIDLGKYRAQFYQSTKAKQLVKVGYQRMLEHQKSSRS